MSSNPKTVVAVILLLGLLCSCISRIAAQTKIRDQFGVRISMRDGAKLAADIFLPITPGRYPTIFEITPYGRGTGVVTGGCGERCFRNEHRYWVENGYVFVMVDERGRGDSEGEFDWMYPDINDGYDVVEWIAKQPWSNGKVGMRGASYTGTSQWYAAKNRPPHLSCINPSATIGRPLEEMPYNDGAFRLGWALSWINETADRSEQGAFDIDWDAALKHRPLATLDEFLGRKLPMYRKFLEHSTLDEYWKRIQFTEADFRRIDIPTLAFTGWYDGTEPGTIFYYEGMKEYSPAKDRQYIVIGPWIHATAPKGGHDESDKEFTRIADLDFPKDSLLPGLEIVRAFFDTCLKGGPKFQQASAKIYLMGSNRWLDLPQYPPPNVKVQPMYLHSDGTANALKGNGTLSWDVPKRQEKPDEYNYDPMNPVPNHYGDKGNPRDGFKEFPVNLAPVLDRPDVLVYVSDLMTKPLSIAGNVVLILAAASDARDTDFTSFIEDVGPDGRGMKLGPLDGGQIRARYRNGFDHEELLTPNQPTEMKIDYFDIGHTFLPGHRIRVSISSSTFPYITANPNTGNPIATDTDPPKVAHQRIFHDPTHMSRVLLPVIPEP